jgi:DNA-directed RNA polymerase, mitochondrial
LQHYAALGRDREGAAAVNLIDSPTPQDVYTRIARHVRAAVTAEAEATSSDGGVTADLARRVRSAVDRKLVKQTVMTTVYGVTLVGARDQIINR